MTTDDRLQGTSRFDSLFNMPYSKDLNRVRQATKHITESPVTGDMLIIKTYHPLLAITLVKTDQLNTL